MLYDRNIMLRISIRIYEYLHRKVPTLTPARALKMDKKLHRSSVVLFLSKLHPSAGSDFIWEFLLYQFYIFSRQEHQNRPLPSWFFGAEAWVRWAEATPESKWHCSKWASHNGFKNPVANKNYTPLSSLVLDKEKMRMSRISGPNFCFAKFGKEAYIPDSDICFNCPFYKDCEALTTKVSGGKTFYEQVSEKELSKEEFSHLFGNSVILR